MAFHSAGSDSCVENCRECGEPMHSIYDSSIRHTCNACGGKSLSPNSEEIRAEIRRDYLAKVREARRA